MPASFENKVFAITGGAGGIGLQTAKLLASQGAKISICDYDKDVLETARKDLENNHNAVLLTAPVDVRNTQQVNGWIDQTVGKFGRLDGAVNLAGIIRAEKGVSSIDDDVWNWIIDTNVTGTMKCLRAEMTAMEKHGIKGSIVNAGSISSLRGYSIYSAYTAAKHAVLGLTRAAAQDGGKHGIRVNAICPVAVEGKMVQDESKRIGMEMTVPGPLNRRITEEEVARAILWLLSDESSFVTGSAQDLTGGSYP